MTTQSKSKRHPNPLDQARQPEPQKAKKQAAAPSLTCKRCGSLYSASRDKSSEGLCRRCKEQEFRARRREFTILRARNIFSHSDSWVILDVKTTRLDYDADDYGEVVKIALLDLVTGEYFESLVKPAEPILPEATALHGITNEMVQDAPDFLDVYQQVWGIIAGRNLVVYSQPIVRYPLEKSAARYQIEVSIGLDSLEYMYSDYIGKQIYFREGRRPKPLPGGDHTSLGDCQAILRLLTLIAETELPADQVGTFGAP